MFLALKARNYCCRQRNRSYFGSTALTPQGVALGYYISRLWR